MARPLLPALVAALLCAGPALGHQTRTVRTAKASARAVAGGVGLDVMLVMRLAGARAEAFRARFDVDRSGRFEPGEAALAGDSLATEAIGGFFVRFDGVATAPAEARSRARIADADAVEVAVLLSWPVTVAGEVQLASRAGRDRAGAPVIVARFAALPPLTLVESAPPSTSGVAGPTPLLPGGDGLRATVAILGAPPGPAPKAQENAP